MKIKVHGIGGNIQAWMKHWLTGRKQKGGINIGRLCPVGYRKDQYLELQMFTIYINDLDVGTKCNVSKFVVDTKLGGNVSCEEDGEWLQEDLDRLCLSVPLSICVSLLFSLSVCVIC